MKASKSIFMILTLLLSLTASANRRCYVDDGENSYSGEGRNDRLARANAVKNCLANKSGWFKNDNGSEMLCVIVGSGQSGYDCEDVDNNNHKSNDLNTGIQKSSIEIPNTKFGKFCKRISRDKDKEDCVEFINDYDDLNAKNFLLCEKYTPNSFYFNICIKGTHGERVSKAKFKSCAKSVSNYPRSYFDFKNMNLIRCVSDMPLEELY
jgi:hypothetical protein